jgi:hypothetical protein
MASHWIDSEIQQIRARDHQREGEAHLQPNRNQLLLAKAPDFFAEVIRDIREAAERLNQAFPGDPSRHIDCREDSAALLLKFRDQTASITLDPSGRFIRLHPGSVHGVFHETTFELSVDGQAHVTSYHTEPHSAEGLVKAILRPAFAALKR